MRYNLCFFFFLWLLLCVSEGIFACPWFKMILSFKKKKKQQRLYSFCFLIWVCFPPRVHIFVWCEVGIGIHLLCFCMYIQLCLRCWWKGLCFGIFTESQFKCNLYPSLHSPTLFVTYYMNTWLFITDAFSKLLNSGCKTPPLFSLQDLF